MIRFEHVGKVFDDGTAAVEDFSLEVPSHTTTVLLGSSGCGKTTLLQMVNRMVDPTSGRVWIDDADVASVDPVRLRRRIGYVMQQAGLLPHRTVLDNVLTVPRLTGRVSAADRSRAHELLELVGLPADAARRRPDQLSGGQRQRVGVARALASDPDILLMDEPFSAVDPVVRAELQAELLRIQRELAKTVLFVTHDVDEAVLLGDEVLVLRTGAQVAQRGRGEEILLHPADGFVDRFVGGDRRRLHVEERAGTATVVDAAGRVAGLLETP
ncbi:ATP-binding cassette domain-containing protein [Micrococcus porci]|uniref:ABC transporter ATP-binding protein n=1 Tax=Micrococcus TaxID=1269 RepID=UPI001CC965AC|nr:MULTISPECIES: ATP-binding cassette domain-containing protein [Micrococcus]MCG7423432.1 ATP-binding cassette domain-containing protein [Micrococcus sp. ACRRV]UBH25043.1 ATP-binding cassette domain-containing protein [Micrococcus porci]